MTTFQASPVRLRVQALAMLIALAALCAAAVTGAVIVRGAAARLRDTVAGRAATAAELRFALADLDAQHADSLVPGHSADRPAVLPPGRSAEDYGVGNRLLALLTAQQRRAEVSDLLRRLGADRDEGGRIRSLLDGLGRYDDLSGRSAQADERQPDRPAGHPPEAAVMVSAEAAEVMHTVLLPTVAALSGGYERQAAALENRTRDAAGFAAFATGGCGLGALAVLGYCQWRLARRYHRVVNPPLLAAALAAAAITLAGSSSFLSAADDARAAGHDGLRPWSRLAEARAVAAEAAAAQGRWFVRDARTGALESARFDTLAGRLDALLTPDGEATAAQRLAYRDLSVRYGHFRSDDRHLRELRSAGRLEEATTVLTEIGRGRVAFDFWDFATALDRLAQRRLAVFTAHADDSGGRLSGWPAVPAAALGAAGVLVLAGVRLRLVEYH